MYQYLTMEKQDGIALITFRRPGQLNAMNRAFMDEIIDAFHCANEDGEVKAVLVTGEGRAFMAGADIKEYADRRMRNSWHSRKRDGNCTMRRKRGANLLSQL